MVDFTGGIVVNYFVVYTKSGKIIKITSKAIKIDKSKSTKKISTKKDRKWSFFNF